MSKEPAQHTPLFQKIGAGAYRVLCCILRLLDIRVVAIFGRCIGYLVWAAMPGRRRIVARNMRIVADPTLRGSKLSALVRRNIVRTTMNMACTFKTGLMTEKELERAVTIIGGKEFEAKAADGQTVIGCIPHAGNWEILARIRPLFPTVKRFGSMYRRLDNPMLEEIVLKTRSGYGCEMFSNKKGLKEVFRMAKDGGMLGVLSDQYTKQGVFIPYFGKVTGTTPLPALIYKRCRGNGNLLAVSTRNTGLGKWDVILSRQIETSTDGEDDIATVTQAVNNELARVQKESIIDGFWMHHRWKVTGRFAPNIDEVQKRLIRKYCTLPFRIIVCVPEVFEEAVLTIPFMRELRACRPDMQINVVCPSEQTGFWKSQPYIANVVTTEHPLQQLEADELYKDGPYDYLFMLSENRRVFRELQALMPVQTSGFANSKLGKKLSIKFVLPCGEEPSHRIEDYLNLAARHIDLSGQCYTDASQGNTNAKGSFIAPFSTLGQADCWTAERWKELVSRLEGKVTLLALEHDKEAATTMAEQLGIPCSITQPEAVATILGPNTKLYAVDGLLPQLAALVGCRCHVIMSSRLAAVYAPPGEGHKVVFRHTPCHPCYRTSCDQAARCASEISVDELLAD